jgi:hypothetical protein
MLYLVAAAYAVLASITKWLLDFRLSSNWPRCDTLGGELWQVIPPVYVMAIAFWPVTAIILLGALALKAAARAFLYIHSLNTFSVTESYEYIYQKIVGR